MSIETGGQAEKPKQGSSPGLVVEKLILENKLLLQGSRLFTPKEIFWSTTREQRRAVRREIIQKALIRDFSSVNRIIGIAKDGISPFEEEDKTPLVTTENVALNIWRTRRLYYGAIILPATPEGERMLKGGSEAKASLAYTGFDKKSKMEQNASHY